MKAEKKIKFDVLDKLRNGGNRNFFAGKMMVAFNCSYSTVERWLNNNYKSLVTAAALKIIKEETGLTEAEILKD